MRMSRLLAALSVSAAVVIGLAGIGLQAQDSAKPTAAQKGAKSAVPEPARPRLSLDEAMLRPFSFPFAHDTSLEEVVKYLKVALNAPVVLDVAALQRHELTPQSTVRLELEGVRLKTGLKLLLDQVGLTTKIVAEDHLLVLTDAEGSEDPTSRILAELKTIHREVHDLQDAVEDLTRSIIPAESGTSFRKPTIIQEMPDEKAKPKEDEPPARSRPGI